MNYSRYLKGALSRMKRCTCKEEVERVYTARVEVIELAHDNLFISEQMKEYIVRKLEVMRKRYSECANGY